MRILSRRVLHNLPPLPLVAILLAIGFNVPAIAEAGVIKSIKGRRALIVLEEGETYNLGDSVASRFPDGSRKSVLMVVAVRRGQAVAEIRSGEPEEGDGLKALTINKNPVVKTKKRRRRPGKYSKYGYLSISVGAARATQGVQLTPATRVSLDGTSPFVRVSLANIFKKHRSIAWELGLAMDRLATKGTTTAPICSGTVNCDFNLTGLVPFARIGYIFLPRLWRLEVRTGIDTFIPVSVSSNIVDANPFNPLFFGVAGLRLRIPLSEDTSYGYYSNAGSGGRRREIFEEESYIPISLEYAKYVESSGVSLSRISLSVGYAWH